MQVVGNKQAPDQRVFNIAALSRTTPSLELIQSFGGPGGGGQIRGHGTQSFTNSAEGTVGIVVDGVAQGNVNIRDLFDIQHIEVLEGPQCHSRTGFSSCGWGEECVAGAAHQ